MIYQYKVMLITKRFKKRKIDLGFYDTLSFIIRITSIRLLIAIAIIMILKFIKHMLKLFFIYINRDLDDEIYMDKAEGFIEPD
jgi:hypothetical protein